MTHTLAFRTALLLAATACAACQEDQAPSPRSDRRNEPVQEHTTTRPSPTSISPSTGEPIFALSTFAYAFTQEASDKIFEIAKDNGQMYVVQLDNGVPWSEALSGAPLPPDMRRKWETFKRHRPADHPFYISIAPLDFDRTNLAGPPEGAHMPTTIKGAAFDSDAVKTAYLKYARRVVDYFKPDYLNLGVEAGELTHRKPSAWPAFSRLIEFVMDDLHRDHPDLKIGISFGLQSLMGTDAANRAHDFVEKCDYLGLSFYPYMSKFHEKFGVAPLPEPPDQWRIPLMWARSYTTKPIAICETGYNTIDESVSGFGVHLKGSPELQMQYVEDLGRIAHRDHHLFDVYYFPVDINRVLAALPDKGSSGAILWQENGLLDSNLKPKPAWQAWRDILAGKIAPSASENEVVSSSPQQQTEQAPAHAASHVVAAINFMSHRDLFQTPTPGAISLHKGAGPKGANAMQWSASSSSDDQWQWAVRSVKQGAAARATRLDFDVKGERGGSFIIQVKESDGESFFHPVTTSPQWSHVSIDLAELKLDPGTRQNATLDLDKISQIVLAQSGGRKGTGASIWLANMIFLR